MIHDESSGNPSNGRRDFLYVVTGTVAVIGLGASLWPLIDSFNPAADRTAEWQEPLLVDLAAIPIGERLTVHRHGKPVFISHRTPDEILAARADDAAEMPYPEPDAGRVQRDPWLVVSGTCTNLGCVLLGQKPAERRGRFGGWFCACGGELYDGSGRLRNGPGRGNLEIPAYHFVGGTSLELV